MELVGIAEDAGRPVRAQEKIFPNFFAVARLPTLVPNVAETLKYAKRAIFNGPVPMKDGKTSNLRKN